MAVSVTMTVEEALSTGVLVITITATDGADTITETVTTEEFRGLDATGIQAKFRADVAPSYAKRLEDYKAAKALVGQSFSA